MISLFYCFSYTHSSVANAADKIITVSTSIDYVSEYVFRGTSLARGAVQPDVNLTLGNFNAGIWASVAIGEASAIADDEINFYASYQKSISQILSWDIGTIVYHYPDTPGGLFDFGDNSTLEVYSGVNLDIHLAPSLHTYYDFNREAFTLTATAQHSLPLVSNVHLDFDLTAALVQIKGDTDYQYGLMSVALNYALKPSVNIHLGTHISLSSEDSLNFRRFQTPQGSDFAATTDNTLFWTGIGITTEF